MVNSASADRASAPPPARRSRDDVVTAALRMLDEWGLPDLTMRRLATELEVQPSALYWHVASKQELLALVADRVLEGGRPATGAEADADDPAWRAAVRIETLALRDALLGHRDAGEVVASSFALGLGGAGMIERLSAPLAAAGFDDATTASAATALVHFVLGQVVHQQTRMQADGLGVRTSAGPASDSAVFRFGVELLLDGLAVRRARP